MRFAFLGLLVALGAPGCYATPHAPERAVSALKGEIADLASMARLDGRRTPAAIAVINSDEADAFKHVDEIK